MGRQQSTASRTPPVGYTIDQLKSVTTLLKSAGITVARRADDILAAKREGRKACILAVEGADFANDRLSALQEVYDLGVRIVQPVHNTPNDFAFSQNTKENWGADLKPTGGDLIRELNRLGIVIDVAHMSRQAVATTAKLSSAPIILSHALHVVTRGKWARKPRPLKNITGRKTFEDFRQAVVSTGGVIGVWNLGHTTVHEDLHKLFGYGAG